MPDDFARRASDRHQLGHHAIALQCLIARVEGGELDRNAWVFAAVRTLACSGKGRDGPPIGEVVAPGISFGARGLAEHVIGMGKAFGLALLGALHRFLDIAPEHELLSELAHGMLDRCSNDRLAETADRTAQHAGQPLLILVVQHLAGDHQRPGRGIDQGRAGAAEMLSPG